MQENDTSVPAALAQESVETEPSLGKRALRRNRIHKQIMAAAEELFSSQDFDEVTTAQIAKAAGVSNGTLFRHITSKAGLLIEYMGEKMAQPLPTQRPAVTIDLAKKAIIALYEPFLSLAVSQERNALVFHREVMYGQDESPARKEIVGLVHSFEARIAEILGEVQGMGKQTIDYLAHCVYSAIYMDFLQAVTRSQPMAEVKERVHRSVDYLLANPNRV